MHLAGACTELTGGLWTIAEELDPVLSEKIETYHVIHRRLGVRGASYPLYLASAVAACRRLRDGGFRPDLIHAHVYGAAVPGAVVASWSRIPLVITEHFSGIAQRSIGYAEVRKARFAYERASRILPVSRFLEEAIRSYGVDRPFEVVPNAVDTSVFFPRNEETRAEAKRLLFVGNLEPMQLKGFPTLLNALARLQRRRRDWQLDVIGGGPERIRHEESAIALGLGEHVTFHGSRPKPVIAQRMRDADVLVLPSVMETFGAVLAEALVSGLPVVSTTVGGIPELVDERSGRLVPPDDPVALAAALDGTLESLDTFDREAIAVAARDRYSVEVVGEQLGRIYHSVLADATRPPRRGGT